METYWKLNLGCLRLIFKTNGAIRRHFGKQMNKETKLRIHNITAKAALNSEVKPGYSRKERNNV